jgi:hypothetical protein
MYLGEIVYRCVLVGASFNLYNAILLGALLVIQIIRIKMEERVITGYDKYRQATHWRLIPGIW